MYKQVAILVCCLLLPVARPTAFFNEINQRTQQADPSRSLYATRSDITYLLFFAGSHSFADIQGILRTH